MDAVTDAEDVLRILRVPARGRVAEVGLVGEEEFEGNLRWFWGLPDQIFGFVDVCYRAAETMEDVPWLENQSRLDAFLASENRCRRMRRASTDSVPRASPTSSALRLGPSLMVRLAPQALKVLMTLVAVVSVLLSR